MMKILIADDHDVLRFGLVSMLDARPGFKVVGETSDGLSTLAAVERLHPDLLILDNHMPDMEGIEVARQVGAMGAGCRIMMLTMNGSKASVRRAFRAGVRAYILKENAMPEIFTAIEALALGRRYLSPRLGDIDTIMRLAAESESAGGGSNLLARLTPRERTVFHAVVRGRTSAQIADQLTIGVRTVETHRNNMMAKLGVANKDRLLTLAISKGLIELDEEGNIVGEAFGPIGEV